MRIKHSIKSQFLSVIFDGTSHSGETLAVLVRFVNDSWIIKQELLAIQLLSKSLTGEEVAHELIQVLSVSYSIPSDHLIAAMCDRASVNSVVMRTVKVVYLNILDIGCLSWIVLENTSTYQPWQNSFAVGFHFSPIVLGHNSCGSNKLERQWHHIVLQGGEVSGKFSS